MKGWVKVGIDFFQKSRNPLLQELNELDWKGGLTTDSERIAKHLSAFSNYPGGGFMVFGVENDGTLTGVTQEQCTEIIKKLGNIARQNLEPGIALDFDVVTFENTNLLFVQIIESDIKPVHLRGKTLNDAFTRSVGQTRKMTKDEVKRCIIQSSGERYEELPALKDISREEVLQKIDFQAYVRLAKKNQLIGEESLLEAMVGDGLLVRSGDSYHITNLGAILFARNLPDFEHLRRKAVRVIVYGVKNRVNTQKEIEGRRGYAVGFQGLIKYVNSQLPTNEVIRDALRMQVKMYPELALRELIANALIHQDFFIEGTGPTIEIFSDRIEITNPGRPLISINRFIDHPPKSRNEILASFMRRINLCEERGSGIDKVIFEIEFFQLPPPQFVGENEDFLKAILFAQKPLSEMDKTDRIRACYQHCCLKFVSNEKMTNQSLRKRLNISDGN